MAKQKCRHSYFRVTARETFSYHFEHNVFGIILSGSSYFMTIFDAKALLKSIPTVTDKNAVVRGKRSEGSFGSRTGQQIFFCIPGVRPA